jgi:hypothetical protein
MQSREETCPICKKVSSSPTCSAPRKARLLERPNSSLPGFDPGARSGEPCQGDKRRGEGSGIGGTAGSQPGRAHLAAALHQPPAPCCVQLVNSPVSLATAWGLGGGTCFRSDRNRWPGAGCSRGVARGRQAWRCHLRTPGWASISAHLVCLQLYSPGRVHPAEGNSGLHGGRGAPP